MDDKKRAHRFAVISGKGGVGKTVITANVAAAFSRLGERTLVVDGDLGLANADVILGLPVRHTLPQILRGQCGLGDALLETQGGFSLLPAGSGLAEGTHLTSQMIERLDTLLQEVETRYDVILFDAGAGIGEVVTHFVRLAHTVLLVVTPEPTSMTDAYATVKVLALRFGRRDFFLIVNEASPDRPEEAGAAVRDCLLEVTSRFLPADATGPVQIRLAASIPLDPAVPEAIGRQRLLADMCPHAAVTARIGELAESLRNACCHPSPAVLGQ